MNSWCRSAPSRRRRAPPSSASPRRRCPTPASVSAPGGQLLAARERHEVALLLRLGAEHGDVRGAEAVVRGHRQADRRDRRAPAPRCRCSSRRRHRRRRRSPRGTGCPSGRASASFGSSSRGNCCASSHSRTCGLNLGFGELADAARSSSCSSVRVTSNTASHAGVRRGAIGGPPARAAIIHWPDRAAGRSRLRLHRCEREVRQQCQRQPGRRAGEGVAILDQQVGRQVAASRASTTDGR